MAKATVWRFVRLVNDDSWWLIPDGAAVDINNGVADVNVGAQHAIIWPRPKIGGVALKHMVMQNVRTLEAGKRRVARAIARQIRAVGGTVTIRKAVGCG